MQIFSQMYVRDYLLLGHSVHRHLLFLHVYKWRTVVLEIKGRGRYLLQRLLHVSDSRHEALLQSRKWQLTGMS